MYSAARNLKKQMKRRITLTSLHLFVKFTPRQTSKELPYLLSVKTLTKKVNGRLFEELSHPNSEVFHVFVKSWMKTLETAPGFLLTACQCLSLIGSLHCKGFPPLYPLLHFAANNNKNFSYNLKFMFLCF